MSYFRYGFNSEGHQCAYQRLKQRADRLKDKEQDVSSSQGNKKHKISDQGCT